MTSQKTLIAPRRMLVAALALAAFCYSLTIPVDPVFAQKGKGGKGGKAAGPTA